MVEDDEMLLRHAHRKISELIANKELYETRITYSASFSMNDDTFDFGSKPSDLSVKAAVADIRHFTAQKSPIKMSTLINILRKKSDTEAQMKIDDFKKKWNQAIGTKGEPLGFGMEMMINEITISRALLLDVMVNGDILHLDKEKSALLDYTRGNSMSAHFTLNFIELLIQLVKMLYYFDMNFISKHLPNQG